VGLLVGGLGCCDLGRCLRGVPGNVYKGRGKNSVRFALEESVWSKAVLFIVNEMSSKRNIYSFGIP
jgi:hypothetical protein